MNTNSSSFIMNCKCGTKKTDLPSKMADFTAYVRSAFWLRCDWLGSFKNSLVMNVFWRQKWTLKNTVEETKYKGKALNTIYNLQRGQNATKTLSRYMTSVQLSNSQSYGWRLRLIKYKLPLFHKQTSKKQNWWSVVIVEYALY